MRHRIRSSFTLSNIITGGFGISTVIIGLFFPFTKWEVPQETARYFVLFGVVFLILTAVLAVWKFVKYPSVSVAASQLRFTQSDAWKLYEQFNESIRQLRTLAKDRESAATPLLKDKRYLGIMADIAKAREHCTDKTLNDLLVKALNFEIRCARFGFSPMELKNASELERAHQRVREYINKHIKE